LMNEAETSSAGKCPPTAAATLRAFADEMGKVVKSVDKNHLLSLGTMGGGQCGASGDQYQQVNSSPGIDVCEYHDYGADDAAMPGDQWNGLQVRLNQCKAIGKPLFIGEAGIAPSGSDRLRHRASQFAAKVTAQFAAGVVGYLIWEWRTPGTGGGDQYVVDSGDPLLNVLGLNGTALGGTVDPGGSGPGTGPPGTGPPMGFNHYNSFGNNVNEGLMRDIADAMVKNGMRDAGYLYVNIDDSWQGNRDQAGNITANSNFPSGIKAFGDYVHARGLKLGIYTTPASTSCGGKTGSSGHVQQDVNSFASWGVDFIKLDWCGADYSANGAENIARAWKSAISATGRTMVLSINAGGDSSVAPGASKNVTMWRSGDDICASWFNKTQSHNAAAHDCYTTQHHNGILDYINSSTPNQATSVGPGHWADADMLEVGNPGLSTDEAKTHFSLWSMWSSPLIAGNDPRAMVSGDTTSQILLNKEVIAVDQDTLSSMGRKVRDTNGQQTWVKSLSGGRYAVLGININGSPVDITMTWADLGIAGRYQVRDVWAHSDLGRKDINYTAQAVAAHGVRMLLLTPAG